MLFFTSQSVSSQYYKFDHYSFSEGFGASQALCIQKDSKGFTWIGTENGLYRFDGHKFKPYFADFVNETSFTSNYINKISIDKHDRIWMGVGPQSLNIFDIEKNSVLRYEDENIKPGNFRIFNMVYDSISDITWISSDKGVFYAQGLDICLKKLEFKNADVKSIFGNLSFNSKGEMILVSKLELLIYNLQSEKATIIKNELADQDNKVFNNLTCSYFECDSVLWVGTWEEGLFQYNMKTHKWKQFVWKNDDLIQMGISKIVGFTLDKNLLWLATTDGLKSFNKINNKFESYKTDNAYDPLKVPGAVFTLQETKSEGIWIGTYKGLHRLDHNKQYIKQLFLDNKDKYGIHNVSHVAFEKNASKKDSIIWYATEYGAIYKYDLINKKQIEPPNKIKQYCKNNKESIQPHFVYIDSKNRLWLSSFLKGFIGYDLNNNELIPTQFNKKDIGRVIGIEEDISGQVWLGCYNGLYKFEDGIMRYDSIFNTYLKSIDAAPYVYNYHIQGNTLWCIPDLNNRNSSQLVSYNLLTKKIILYDEKTYPVLKRLNHIQSVNFYSPDKIAITSFHGFATGNVIKDNLELKYQEQINGIYTNGTGSLVTNKKEIFMGTDRGVILYDPNSSQGMLMTYDNSTLGSQINPSLFYSEKSNTIYISQAGDLQYFKISDIPSYVSQDILLTAFKVNDSTWIYTPKHLEKIYLKPDQNSLELSFSNLCFTNSIANVYEYTLDNGQYWQRINGNLLNFAKLNPGTYELEVRSINSFNIPVKNTFQLTICIAHHFWQTWWFQLLLLALMGAILYAIFRYRELQRIKLEKLRHTLARDLHDDMGSSLSYIKLLSDRQWLSNQSNTAFKSISEKTSEVMGNMSEIIWSINPKHDKLINVISKIQTYAIEVLEPLGLDIHFDISPIPESIILSPEEKRNFYLIFKESINNAAKYAKATTVTFKVEVDKNNVKAQLIDDGVGFDMNTIYSGNGLSNLKNRALLLEGKLDILSDKNGTVVSLSMKI